MIDEDVDTVNEREAKAQIQITRVDNGYRVRGHEVLKKKRRISTMFGPAETNVRDVELVFSNLADVVEFLGKHYQEPTRAIAEAPNA